MTKLRGILNVSDDCKSFSLIHSLVVPALREKWLSSTVGDFNITISGYKVFWYNQEATWLGRGVGLLILTVYLRPLSNVALSQRDVAIQCEVYSDISLRVPRRLVSIVDLFAALP